jgi:hypothetical protein
MKKILIKLINIFIPSKKLRRKLRAKTIKHKTYFLKNIFKTKYKKHMLISYLTEPFQKKINLKHTNKTECYSAAEIFNKLGYTVDVIDFSSDVKIDYNKYEVIYGFGRVFENSFYSSDANIKRIFYGTGCSTHYSNYKGVKRVEKFNKKYNVNVFTSGRFTNFLPLQHYSSDVIITLGNDFSANTYKIKDANLIIHSLDLFYFNDADRNIKQKDFSSAKKHFLWFGSMGLIHKGLDLCIEYFKKNPDLTLHICGVNSHEQEFFNVFKDELGNKISNIINYGFIDIKGDEFKNIIKKCAFTIYPTISEGGSPALLNVMVNGLIPITTEACSLDLKGLGFIIKDLTVKSIDEQVKKALKLSNKEIENLSRKVKNNTKKRYTLKRYKENLEKIIKKSLKDD